MERRKERKKERRKERKKERGGERRGGKEMGRNGKEKRKGNPNLKFQRLEGSCYFCKTIILLLFFNPLRLAVYWTGNRLYRLISMCKCKWGFQCLIWLLQILTSIND